MKKVLLLLCRGVEVYEAAAFYDVLGWSSVYGLEKVEVVTVGLQKEVRGTFGLRFLPDRLIGEISPADFDALAVPGGFELFGYYDDAYSEPVLDLIRRFAELDRPVASICVGALPLAKSGILKGRRATTYSLGEGERCRQLEALKVEFIEEPIVRDGKVTTSCGPGTAVEVAFQLLADLTGRENSDIIRKLMGFPTAL